MARNDLPSPNAPNFPQRLREAVMTYLGRTGDPLDRGITLRDLIEGGFARLRDGYTAGQAAASGGALPIAPESQVEEPDLTPPPTPTGFTVSAAISHVFIEHDAPLYTQGHGHLRTRVYGKIVAQGDPLPVFADAVELTQFTGTVHAHPSNPSTTWRLWIKWESAGGVLSVSPAGGTNGLQVVTGQDVSSLVAAMTGEGKPFTVLTEPTVIGGVTFPAGIYSTQAFIRDLQVTNAKIADLAVDTAKIADLAVDTGQIADLAVTDAKIESLDAEKITTGYLSADRIEAGSLDAKIANIDAAVITSGVIDIARIEDGSITNAKIGDAEIEMAKIKTATITSLSALSANIGTVTAGILRNGPMPTTFLDLNATGDDEVFSAGGGKVRITADGDAYFTAVLAEGQWTGSVPLRTTITEQVWAEYSGAEGGGYWATQTVTRYPEQVIEIDTGFNWSRTQRLERTLSARLGNSTPGFTIAIAFNELFQPGGTYTGSLQIEMGLSLRAPTFANGADPIVVQAPYGVGADGSVNSRVFLVVRVKMIDNPTNRNPLTLTALKWTLDAVG
jgi:hypothetical protein